MDENELTSYIVKELGEGHNPKDVILDICEKTGCTWLEAEKMVTHIQVEQEPEISTRQFPVLFVFALGTFLGGLALVAYAVATFMELWKGMEQLFTNAPISTDTYIAMRVLTSSGVWPPAAMVTGMAMLLGSLVGMRKAWAAILFRE
jgi:hypothetical protein